jgi:hypothetical protein
VLEICTSFVIPTIREQQVSESGSLSVLRRGGNCLPNIFSVHVYNTHNYFKIPDYLTFISVVALCSSQDWCVSRLQIHFHGQDWTSLHKFVPPEVLPEEYGGHIPEVDFPKIHKYLYDNEEKLMGKAILLSLIYSEIKITYCRNNYTDPNTHKLYQHILIPNKSQTNNNDTQFI